MDHKIYWQLFLRTGSPEAYLMFNEARRMEQSNVSHHQGTCSPGNTI